MDKGNVGKYAERRKHSNLTDTRVKKNNPYSYLGIRIILLEDYNI